MAAGRPSLMRLPSLFPHTRHPPLHAPGVRLPTIAGKPQTKALIDGLNDDGKLLVGPEVVHLRNAASIKDAKVKAARILTKWFKDGLFDASDGFINDDFDQGRHHAIYRLTTIHFVRMWAVLLLFLPPSNRWFNKIQEQRKREKEAALHGLGPIIKL
jgi:hypothetical protein